MVSLILHWLPTEKQGKLPFVRTLISFYPQKSCWGRVSRAKAALALQCHPQCLLLRRAQITGGSQTQVQKEAGEQNKGLHNPEGAQHLLTCFPSGLLSGIANEGCRLFSELLLHDTPPSKGGCLVIIAYSCALPPWPKDWIKACAMEALMLLSTTAAVTLRDLGWSQPQSIAVLW